MLYYTSLPIPQSYSVSGRLEFSHVSTRVQFCMALYSISLFDLAQVLQQAQADSQGKNDSEKKKDLNEHHTDSQ